MKILIAVLLIFGGSLTFGAEWSYKDQAKWSELFPECGGREQSPIDISMNRLFYNASTRLALDNFSTLSPAYEVVNNGHTVMFSYLGDSATAPAVTGLAGERYELAQFHLHWGQKGVPGSEHTIDGRRYDMELHMVFYNRAKYSIFERAVNSRKNGVLVLGVFYEAKKMANLKLKTLTRNIRKVSDTTLSTFGTAVPVDAPIRLDDLIPEVTPRFPQPIYQYRGSLTIPPCTEGITWLVMATPRIIGRKQIQVIQSVQDGEINSNYRTVQPLNGRLVQWIDLKESYESGVSDRRSSKQI